MVCIGSRIREQLSKHSDKRNNASNNASNNYYYYSIEANEKIMGSKHADVPAMEFKNEISGPPSYTESGPATSTSAAANTSTPNTLHVYMTDWKQRSMRIMSGPDSDSENPSSGSPSMLYHVELHSTRSPNMTFRRPDPNTAITATVSDVEHSSSQVATANFHSMHTYIDVDVSGHSLRLSATSKWKMTDYTYPSAAFGGTVTWTSPSPVVVRESVLQDANGNAVAKTVPVEWAKKKATRIEFAKDPSTMSQEEVDEVVVTGMAFFYYRYLLQAATAAH